MNYLIDSQKYITSESGEIETKFFLHFMRKGHIDTRHRPKSSQGVFLIQLKCGHYILSIYENSDYKNFDMMCGVCGAYHTITRSNKSRKALYMFDCKFPQQELESFYNNPDHIKHTQPMPVNYVVPYSKRYHTRACLL